MMRRHLLTVQADRRVLVTDTITTLTDSDSGAVVVSGSHGGVSSAQFVVGRGLSGVFYNDAGVGRDQAGIAGLAVLDDIGVPGLAFGHLTAEIGDGEDAWDHGIVTYINNAAQRAGGRVGTSVRTSALDLGLGIEHLDNGLAAVPKLHRRERQVNGLSILLLDSVSLLESCDAGRVVVTGSHGGAVSGEYAMRHSPALVVYNDAGGGKNCAGWRALGRLDTKRIAALTVRAESGRIGDPADMLEHGVISHVNLTAAALGLPSEGSLDAALSTLGENAHGARVPTIGR